MKTYSVQRNKLDSSLNPFLRTGNPFKVSQKFYTHPSSQQKYNSNSKSLTRNHLYNSSCNHCVNLTPKLQQMQAKSIYLKNEKQNLHKISSTRYKNFKNMANPFQKPYLISYQATATSQNTAMQYSRKDQSKLQNLIYNNPFKKYRQEKQNYEQDYDIKFNKIDMVRVQVYKKKQQSRVQTSRFGHYLDINKKESARFSIQSFNNNTDRNYSIQNSPMKKSRFTPSINDVPYKVTSLGSSNNYSQRKSFNADSCLIQQISRSRKDILKDNRYQRQNPQPSKDMYSYNQQNNQPQKSYNITKIPPKIQSKQSKQYYPSPKQPQFIIIKGKKFYKNKVQLKY